MDIPRPRPTEDDVFHVRAQGAQGAREAGEIHGTFLSWVLTVLHDEPGAGRVAGFLPTAAIGAVNLAEVLIVLERRGVLATDARHALDALALDVLPADAATAHAAAGIAAANPRRGLSLGDCFCLATAHLTGRSAVTVDRTWATLKTGAKVVVVRG